MNPGAKDVTLAILTDAPGLDLGPASLELPALQRKNFYGLSVEQLRPSDPPSFGDVCLPFGPFSDPSFFSFFVCLSVCFSEFSCAKPAMAKNPVVC